MANANAFSHQYNPDFLSHFSWANGNLSEYSFINVAFSLTLAEEGKELFIFVSCEQKTQKKVAVVGGSFVLDGKDFVEKAGGGGGCPIRGKLGHIGAIPG